MKRKFTRNLFIGLIFSVAYSISGNAQCPLGYTAAELNWDHLDFLPSNNTRYTSFYPSTAFPYTQNFTIGTRTINFQMAPQASITLNGENGTNTAHAGSFATAGDDVQFTTTVTTSTTITMTFDADVANVMFSLFDLDAAQRVNVVGVDGTGTGQVITIVNANAGSGITIAGSGTTSATATGPGTNYANNSNNGTINITIAGPVRRITLTLNNAAGDIWLSDIDACVTGSFPNNYQQISRPFTGQPQYVLTVVNNNIYYVDPTNGRAYFLFNEPAHNRLNSMAYDPYERIVYYTFSLTGGTNPRNDKTLKKYDVDTKTISVVIPNVNTFGIPTYESGVESGAATFYNGSLYLGIEGYTGTSGGGAYAASRKSTIWKITFDAAGNPIAPAAQVWGVTADNGTDAQNIHDWSDFGISNGILYDFDGSQSGDVDYYHVDLMTGVETNYLPVNIIPRQLSIGWDEKLYDVDADISLYNGTNGVGTPYIISAPLGPVIPTGSAASWGDAAGPYRPFLDFGDAPASYDPDPLSPACHDTLTPTISGTRRYMRLGPAEDVEWLKKGLTTVEDNFEDGLIFVPIFSPPSGTYQLQISAFNNTNANARVVAWLDFNANGTFDVAESCVPVTVPSSAAAQSFWLMWPGAPSTLPTGAMTYLRIRITSSAYGMGAANATGYYDMGEVEDYRVLVVNDVLPVTLTSFEAEVRDNSKVKLNWSANETGGSALGYDIERSTNGTEWEFVKFVQSSGQTGMNHYETYDYQPYTGTSYYRLKVMESGGPTRYSNIRTVKITSLFTSISIFPNPAIDKKALLKITGGVAGEAAWVRISGINGKLLTDQKFIMIAESTTIELPIGETWPAGVYVVEVIMGDTRETRKLILSK